MSESSQANILEFAVRLIVLFTAFPVHESAHALVAHLLGDNTAKDKGRISLNPFKHINLWGVLFMLFVGVGAATPVPINPNNFKHRKTGMAISSLAGPLSNLLLAYLNCVFYRFCYDHTVVSGTEHPVLSYFFAYAAILNVALAVFNLLPIPPLDGSRIITVFLPEKKYFGIMKYEKYIMGALFAVIFAAMYIPALADKIYAPLSYLQNMVMNGLLWLCGWVDIFFI